MGNGSQSTARKLLSWRVGAGLGGGGGAGEQCVDPEPVTFSSRSQSPSQVAEGDLDAWSISPVTQTSDHTHA